MMGNRAASQVRGCCFSSAGDTNPGRANMSSSWKQPSHPVKLRYKDADSPVDTGNITCYKGKAYYPSGFSRVQSNDTESENLSHTFCRDMASHQCGSWCGWTACCSD